ncbi:MAG: glycosyltransferase [Scytolyngbya sp. HA4215-MV1]|nr:glycosyltransferase [Scytolyngbya sp. HA4215-MV1]
MNLSVVIPAYNSAETITQTIESLQAQTLPHWEAIVVNDGSTDETATIVSRFVQQDARIRFINQPHRGVSIARNEGIHLAKFDWLLFLDADDWIAPTYLEKMLGQLATHPDFDVVHCSSVRVAANGTCYGRKQVPLASDLFAELARYCPFSINACIVRKALVLALGGFDPFFYNNQDWDLWQRIARTGARFVAVPEVLAFYRMRHNSHSSDSTKRFTYGLRTLIQGHSPDPRVPNPHPAHVNGMPAERLPGLKLLLATWCAGTVLGVGKDARYLLDLLEAEPIPDLDPLSIALCLLESLPVPTTESPGILWERWSEVEPCVNDFLFAMETKSQAPLLTDRVRVILDRLILQQAEAPLPLALGKTYAIRVEVTEPLRDLYPPVAVERAYCLVEAAGSPLGTLELPVCDGVLSAVVMADAIAANFAWQILGRFFEQTLYAKITTADNFQSFHDEQGWLIFLQQLWNCPDWSNADFYNPHLIREVSTLTQQIEHNELTLEISEALPNVSVSASELTVLLTVGGSALGFITVPVEKEVVTAQALRVALLLGAGAELCCAVVREGLLGRSLSDPTSLRNRLSEAAQQKSNHIPMWQRSARDTASDQGKSMLVLGRRSGDIGTSDSRWARLPAATAAALLESAIATHEPLLQLPTKGCIPSQVLYAPDVILSASPYQPTRFEAKPQVESAKFNQMYDAEAALPARSWLRRFWRNAVTTLEQLHPESPHPPSSAQVPLPSQQKRLKSHLVDLMVTQQLAILKYHPIVVDRSQANGWRMTPQTLAEQLRYLQEAGYYSVNLQTWHQAMTNRQALPGRAILITFDDESLAFYTEAFPLLEKYGFSATVFLAIDRIEQSNDCPNERKTSTYMNWQQIRQLQASGIEFGSRSLSHRPLTGLSVTEVVQEAARSRTILARELGTSVRSFAYPDGDYDPVVQHLIGACGYTFGLTHRPERSHFRDARLALPRIEIKASDLLQDFVAKLS